MGYALSAFGAPITISSPIGNVTINVPTDQLINEAWPTLKAKLNAEIPIQLPKMLKLAEPTITKAVDAAAWEGKKIAALVVGGLLLTVFVRHKLHKKTLGL